MQIGFDVWEGIYRKQMDLEGGIKQRMEYEVMFWHLRSNHGNKEIHPIPSL